MVSCPYACLSRLSVWGAPQSSAFQTERRALCNVLGMARSKPPIPIGAKHSLPVSCTVALGAATLQPARQALQACSLKAPTPNTAFALAGKRDWVRRRDIEPQKWHKVGQASITAG